MPIPKHRYPNPSPPVSTKNLTHHTYLNHKGTRYIPPRKACQTAPNTKWPRTIDPDFT